MFDQIHKLINNSLISSTCIFTLMIAINAKYGYLTKLKVQESESVPKGVFFAIWLLIYSGLLLLYTLLWYNRTCSIIYVSERNYNQLLFFLNIVHILNSLWIILNILPKENNKIRLLLQSLVIYLMVFFLFLTYENVNSKNDMSNILIGNVITLYLGWVICASFVSTILLIYVYYPKIDKINKYLGFIWIAIAIKYFMSKYETNLSIIKPINYGFYGALSWGLIGVLWK
jgi:hypothetical protein